MVRRPWSRPSSVARDGELGPGRGRIPSPPTDPRLRTHRRRDRRQGRHISVAALHLRVGQGRAVCGDDAPIGARRSLARRRYAQSVRSAECQWHALGCAAYRCGTVALSQLPASCPFLSADQPKSMEQWQQIGHHMAWCLATYRRTVVATLQKGRIRSERRQSRAGRVR